MAETTEFLSTIRVKDLISAFESKCDSVKVEFSRPRAKSVGNILAKNVVVRQNEFNSLDDIEQALRKLETSLNFYEVYNKGKHVAFQEHLFNILTSIVNIEGNGDDSTARKKKLIAKTQTLVSFLNQKLPSNASQLINSPTNQYKYTTYSTHVKQNGTEPSKQNYAIYSEKNKPIDITDSGQEFSVSVRKLKENFQPKNETKPENIPKDENNFKAEHTLILKTAPVTNGQKLNEEETEKPEKVEEQTPENVSVLKLRNLFEKKSEETSKGLGIITDDKPRQDKLVVSSTSINIPYTERNLGNVRLQRSVSGNYMNYTGLLKRIDISKSTSDLNREPAGDVGEDLSDRSNTGSEDSLDTIKDRKSVREIRKIYLQPSLDKAVTGEDRNGLSEEFSAEGEDSLDAIENRISVPEIRKVYSQPSLDKGIGITGEDGNGLSEESDAESEDSLDTIEERKSVREIRKIYSTPSVDNPDFEKENDATDAANNETVSITQGVKEIKVEYSSTISVKDDKPPTTDIEKTDGKSNVEGFQELEIKYFIATSDDINKDSKPQEEVATVLGMEQEDVEYSTPESNIVSNEESVVTFNGVEGNENFSFASSGLVRSDDIENRNIINNSTFITGSLHEESSIEDEIDKIDVDKTLADEDIVVDAEELKNADNEFEKLLESSGTRQIVT